MGGHRSHSAFFLAAVFLLIGVCHAHNITTILSSNSDFSKFNKYLTDTHLANDINSRATITVLALDNAAMDALLAKGLSIYTLKNVLGYHVLVDYYDASKLHGLTGGSTLSSTIFQSTGGAPGTTGYVNITNLSKGQVGFAPENNNGEFNSLFVKSLHENPFNISVLQISQELASPEAEAPVAAPSVNLTEILRTKGCKAFSDLLIASGAEETFDSAVEGGMTVFCPPDSAVKSFEPKYKNLTAAGKSSLLLFHGLPVFLSMQMLLMNNGPKSTLATVRNSNYILTVQTNGTAINLITPINAAKITSTLKSEDQLVVYMIDDVLMPKELFKPEIAPAPAPAPSPHAAPKASAPSAESPESVAEESPNNDKKSSAVRTVFPVFAALFAVCSSLAF